jgi:AcrR family transcriptional regulator
MEAQGIRARNRQALMAAIIRSANRQLLEVGPADLSVRAVARDLDMASSAIYRYVRSRDELLTLLIIEGYDDMAKAGSKSPRDRFRAVGMACRQWALDQPHRFALIYGSPVPGYAAPQDTIAPATRIPALLVGILQQSAAHPAAPAFTVRVERSLRPVLEGLREWGGLEQPAFSEAAMALGIMAWTHIIGSISFELFGHRHNVVGESAADRRAYFQFEMDVLADLLAVP